MTVRAKSLKEKKVKAIDKIKGKIAESNVIILTDYSGLSVKQITDLRRKLRPHNAEYRVFKNTLMVKALPAEMTSLTEMFSGPIAVIFGKGELSAPAKELVKFIGENEKPKLLSGVVESVIFSDKQIKELSKLPSRSELLAKVVGGVKSPLYGIVSVLHGPLRKLVYTLVAIKDKK